MAHVANITIQSSKVPGDLTDYVVYVDLNDLPSSFWNTVANGGGDIRVYKEGGTTELAREVVSCDTATDTGELYFKYTGTLSSSSNTIVEIHADGVSSDYAVTATYGRNNVWTDFVLVYHLEEEGNVTAGGYIDSTGNGNDGTGVSMTTSSDVTAQLGKGQNFDGSADYITIPDISGDFGTNNATLTMWVKNDVAVPTISTRAGLIDLSTGSSDTHYPWTNGSAYINIFRSARVDLINLGGFDVTNLHHFAVTTTPGANGWKFYQNSGLVTQTTGESSVSISTSSRLAGNDGGTTRYHDGIIDELRLTDVERSADWLETEYNNQSDTSTFYAVTDITGSSLATTKPMQPIWFF